MNLNKALMTDDALSEFAPENMTAEPMDQHVETRHFETSDRLVGLRAVAIALASVIALAALVAFLSVALASLHWARVSIR